MVIGSCTIDLELAENGSLKGKRRVVKSIAARLRQEFNVAVAEVDLHEVWQQARLGVVCVSTDAGHAHGLLTKAVERVSHMRVDAHVADYQIEIIR